MLTSSKYAYLRYVLLVNVVVALIPAMSVRGRVHDPLLHAGWWTLDQHSAVLVVATAAVAGSALALGIMRLNIPKRLTLIGCCVVVGIFPGTFYYLLAPASALADLPLADMYLTGTVCGVLGGLVLYWLLHGNAKPRASA
jgi:hypothetical protein